ncbi:MAG: DUF401 family protein [Bacillota bacterium]
METLGLAAAFVAIIVLGALRARLWITMTVGTAILLLGGAGPPGSALVTTLRAAVDPATLELVLTVALIMLLAGLLKNSILLGPMSRSLAGMLRSDRLAFALVPGILGCLPVPGGAGLSAPMVDGLGETLGMSPARKATANVLLRHAWFFVFPFSPSLILSAHLSGLTVSAIIARQWPLTVLAVLTAALLFLSGSAGDRAPYRPWGREALDFLATASPIFVSVALFLGARLPLPLALSVGIVFACLVACHRGTFQWRILRMSADWEMPLATELIMIFAALVRETPGLATLITAASARAPLAAIMLASVLTGFLTANPVAGLGIALPALLPMVPMGQDPGAYVCLIFGLTFQAYLVSPLHMCLILTNRYFEVSLGQAYRYLLPPVALNAAGVILLFLLTR